VHAKGRQGGIVVLCPDDACHLVPMVRSTTAHPAAPKPFAPVHTALAQLIPRAIGLVCALKAGFL
jgi:hypothetical protein